MAEPRANPRFQVWLQLPGGLWIFCFFLLPLLMLLGTSVLSRNDAGEVGLPVTGESYLRFLGSSSFGFELLYPRILLHTSIIALTATAVGLAAALPLSFFIAGLKGRWRTAALILVVIPMWTNLVIRTYAWQLLLGPDSWTARAASALGFISAGDALHPGTLAVLVGMVCDYLPFLILPLYASVERIDDSLADAARDLGARPLQVFRHAILPQIQPGLAAASFLTFIPALGQFLIPDLLGGGKSILLGNVLQQQFGVSGDWPFGAAITVMTLLSALAACRIFTRRT